MEANHIAIYQHKFPTSRDSSLVKLLKKYLPHSIVLFRRIVLCRESTPGLVILATFPEDAMLCPTEFMVTLVDREGTPSSDIFPFSSLEIRDLISAQEGRKEQHDDVLARRQLLSLLLHIRSIPIPSLRTDDGISPNVVFMHALHSSVAKILRSYPHVVMQEYIFADGPFTKYVWRMSDQLHVGEEDLGELEWDRAYDEDKELIAANNPLIRRKSRLQNLPCYGLRPKASPEAADAVAERALKRRQTLVSWAILDRDGSLRSLHTQPEYRGRGLAKKVAALMIKHEWLDWMRYGGGDVLERDEADDWLHADVAPDNIASIKTFQALGAQPLDQRFWIRIDVDQMNSVLER